MMSFSKTLILAFVFTLVFVPARVRADELPENLLRKSLEGLQVKMKAVAEKNNQLEQKNRILRQQVMDLSRQISAVGERKISNSEDFLNLQKKMADSLDFRAKQADFAGRKEKLAAEKRDLRARLDSRQKNLSDTGEKIDALKDAIAAVKQNQGSEAPDPARRKKKESLQAMVDEQKSRLSGLRKDISSTQDEIKNRRLARQEEQRYNNTLRQKRDQVIQALKYQENQAAFLDKQKERFLRLQKQAVASVKEEISGYEETRQRLSEVSDGLQKIKGIEQDSPTKEDLRQMMDKLAEERRALNDLEANRLELEKQNSQLNERDTRVASLKRDLQELQARAGKYRQEQQSEQKRLVDLKQREQGMIDQRKDLMDEISRLRQAPEPEKDSAPDSTVARQRKDLEERITAQKQQNSVLRDETARAQTQGLQAQSVLAEAKAHGGELSRKAQEARDRLQAVQLENARMMDKIKHFEADSRLSAKDVAGEVEALKLRRDVLETSLSMIKDRYNMEDLNLESIQDEKQHLKEYLKTLKRDHDALKEKGAALGIAMDQVRRRGLPAVSAQARSENKSRMGVAP